MRLIQFNTKPTLYECEPNWTWKMNRFHDYDFWVALSGKGNLTLNGNKTPLSAGAAFVLRPGDRVWGTHDSANPIRAFAFHFSSTMPPLPSTENLPFRKTFRDLTLLETLTRQAAWPLVPEPNAVRTAEMACATLLSLFCEPPKTESSDLSRLEACAHSIRARPSQTTRIPDMARECGMSEGHFSRRFKALFGLSPTQFRLQARLARARHLLEHSDLSLAEISDATGFHDEMHFSRIFHRETGHPPGAYRRTSKAERGEAKM